MVIFSKSLYIYKFKSIKTRGRGKLRNGRTGPTDMHIKMTVMTWSNMLTNKINELTKNNGVITKNVILRRGEHSKDVEIFKARKKKFRQSAN